MHIEQNLAFAFFSNSLGISLISHNSEQIIGLTVKVVESFHWVCPIAYDRKVARVNQFNFEGFICLCMPKIGKPKKFIDNDVETQSFSCVLHCLGHAMCKLASMLPGWKLQSSCRVGSKNSGDTQIAGILIRTFFLTRQLHW